MNPAMSSLAKGVLAIVVVAAVLITAIAALFRQSPDAGPSAGRGPLERSKQATAVAPAPSPPPAPPAKVAEAPPRNGTDFSPAVTPWSPLLETGDEAAGRELAEKGRPGASIAACSSCHGAQGIPAQGTPFPMLAGDSPQYLAKQLLDYRNGTRRHPIMTQIAKSLSEADIGAVAKFYGAIAPAALPPDATASSGRGQQLHEFGDNSLALAACANCHGVRGAGEAPLLPRLAGQPPAYFTSQIEAFRQGQRTNDDVGIMQAISKRLTPADTAALAEYYGARRNAQ